MPIRLRPIAGEHEGVVPGMSRREFLAGLAAGGFGALASGCARRPAGSRGNPGGWFAWLSEVHIAADPSTQLRGETPAANLRAAVAGILAAENPPRGVLIDGDLAYHDGQPGDYRTFLALVEPLCAKRASPCTWCWATTTTAATSAPPSGPPIRP